MTCGIDTAATARLVSFALFDMTIATTLLWLHVRWDAAAKQGATIGE